MALNFPAYTVDIHWLREVQSPVVDQSDFESVADSDGKLCFGCRKNAQLHGVAMEVLIGVMSARSHSYVLYSSCYALRALHVIATGILGLLRKCPGQIPTEAEANASLSAGIYTLPLTVEPVAEPLNRSTLGLPALTERFEKSQEPEEEKSMFTITWKNYQKESSYGVQSNICSSDGRAIECTEDGRSSETL